MYNGFFGFSYLSTWFPMTAGGISVWHLGTRVMTSKDACEAGAWLLEVDHWGQFNDYGPTLLATNL